MKIDVARAYAQSLLAAADKAEQEGRDHLVKADIDIFAAADDVARAELEQAINALTFQIDN